MEIRQIIWIRWRQLGRGLAGLSVLHWLLFLIIAFVATAALLQLLMGLAGAAVISGLFAGLVLSLHLSRSDRQFVKLYAAQPWMIYLCEYVLLTVPLLLLLLLTPYWYLGGALLAAMALVALLPYSYKPSAAGFSYSRWLPAQNFEWIAGFRKYGLYILLLYLVALLLVPVKLLSLFLLWFITSILLGFYQECEPLHLLRLSGAGAAGFLRKKLLQHLKLYLLFCLPLLLIYIMFHLDMWYLPLVFMLLLCLNVCFFILSKYAFYRPGMSLAGSSLLSSLAMLSSLLPFLILLPLVMNVRFYAKAVSNLNSYLDD
ncbi:hypothetical protein [Pontibacter beigongshangensis]|uniref:hypothetical protein n=1 Tax=Pontibacter beigongshangensis TaxID=2574733 RepID=UPI00164F541F|nr:hypothetical protein [Pontibacter beigongshangensis]